MLFLCVFAHLYNFIVCIMECTTLCELTNILNIFILRMLEHVGNLYITQIV